MPISSQATNSYATHWEKKKQIKQWRLCRRFPAVSVTSRNLVFVVGGCCFKPPPKTWLGDWSGTSSSVWSCQVNTNVQFMNTLIATFSVLAHITSFITLHVTWERNLKCFLDFFHRFVWTKNVFRGWDKAHWVTNRNRVEIEQHFILSSWPLYFLAAFGFKKLRILEKFGTLCSSSIARTKTLPATILKK